MLDAKQLAKEISNLEKDDLLRLIGLETRKGPMDSVGLAVGAFTAGLLVGAGIALMLAPKSGPELREELRGRMGGGQQEDQESAGPMQGSEATKVRAG